MTPTPFELYQLIAVRRDLPLIQVPIQGGHAIGLATYAYARRLFHEPGAEDPRWGHPFRLWCGVQNQAKLEELAEQLRAQGLLFETVVEPDEEAGLKNQPTALCTHPYPKEVLGALRGRVVFDLDFKSVQAFKVAAVELVVKQLSAQLDKGAKASLLEQLGGKGLTP